MQLINSTARRHSGIERVGSGAVAAALQPSYWVVVCPDLILLHCEFISG
jgi:hypothetical protein